MYYALPVNGLPMSAEFLSGQPRANPPAATSVWGVEILRGRRWALLRSGWLRRVNSYRSYEEAVEAAVRAWQRYDCPARPLRLDAAPPSNNAS